MLFIRLAAAFAVTAVIGHKKIITTPGEIAVQGAPALQVVAVAMKIKYNPSFYICATRKKKRIQPRSVRRIEKGFGKRFITLKTVRCRQYRGAKKRFFLQKSGKNGEHMSRIGYQLSVIGFQAGMSR